MRRPADVLQVVLAVKARLAAVAGQSERVVLVNTVLLASAVSLVTGFVLSQYYSVDVMSSLLFPQYDCVADLGAKIGHHCFSDYTLPVSYAMRANPWEAYHGFPGLDFGPAYNNYTAAGMVPLMIFGVLGKYLGNPQFGLLGYLFALTGAVLVPAAWAARGASGLGRLPVFATCGIAAIPAWMAIDRGNSVGFVVPVALIFLVALRRQRWGMVAMMVILAALLKPQFAAIGLVLFAARQWRWSGITVAGLAISNIAAYALWPRDFPQTIMQSIHNAISYSGSLMSFRAVNVSFANALLMVPDGIKAGATGGKLPDDFLSAPRLLIGHVVVLLVVVSIFALGRRIPPVMAGMVLLATASLAPAVSCRYYLVFVLPVAALVLRDSDGPPGLGLFDKWEAVGGRRRAVGMCVTLATAVSIAQIALPSTPIHVAIRFAGGQKLSPSGEFLTVSTLVTTTALFASLLWLITCAAIIISYARRPASVPRSDHALVSDSSDTVVDSLSTSGSSSELIENLSP